MKNSTAADSDPWMNADGSALIKMGDIHVQRGWEVSHEDAHHGNTTVPYPSNGSVGFKSAGTRGDEIV